MIFSAPLVQIKDAQHDLTANCFNIKLYKVALQLLVLRVNHLKRDHSNESYWAVLSCGAVYYSVQCGSNVCSVNKILKCVHSNESYWVVLSCGAVYCAKCFFWVCERRPVSCLYKHSQKKVFSSTLWSVCFSITGKQTWLHEKIFSFSANTLYYP